MLPISLPVREGERCFILHLPSARPLSIPYLCLGRALLAMCLELEPSHEPGPALCSGSRAAPQICAAPLCAELLSGVFAPTEFSQTDVTSRHSWWLCSVPLSTRCDGLCCHVSFSCYASPKKLISMAALRSWQLLCCPADPLGLHRLFSGLAQLQFVPFSAHCEASQALALRFFHILLP